MGWATCTNLNWLAGVLPSTVFPSKYHDSDWIRWMEDSKWRAGSEVTSNLGEQSPMILGESSECHLGPFARSECIDCMDSFYVQRIRSWFCFKKFWVFQLNFHMMFANSLRFVFFFKMPTKSSTSTWKFKIHPENDGVWRLRAKKSYIYLMFEACWSN